MDSTYNTPAEQGIRAATVEAQHEERIRIINERLALISVWAQEQANMTKIDWTNVGDLGYVVDELRHIVEFITQSED